MTSNDLHQAGMTTGGRGKRFREIDTLISPLPPSGLLLGSPFALLKGKPGEVFNVIHTGQSAEELNGKGGAESGQCFVQKQIKDVSDKCHLL